MSIVTYEKPLEHLCPEEYKARLWELQNTADQYRNGAFRLRHSGRQLRNDTALKSNWDTYFNDQRLQGRLAEVTRWREILETCLKSVQSEINKLKTEKSITDRALDIVVNTPLAVVSECITLRDGRHGNDLLKDEVYDELNNELLVVEALKTMLGNRCQESWDQLNKLAEAEFQLQLDLGNKNDAMEIDSFNLQMDKDCSGTTYKPDPLRIPKHCIPYEQWLEISQTNKQNMENEITKAIKLREDMFNSRSSAFIAMRAQHDATNFAFRKRIYGCQRAKNEMQWQRLKMLDEIEKVQKETQDLENALRNKTEAIKLAETRLENRMFRGGPELVQDDAQNGMAKEVLQLRETRQNLMAKIASAKSLYSGLQDHLSRINVDLDNKQHSLMTDLRCVDTRLRLLTMEGSFPKAAFLSLTPMLQEIPKSLYIT